MNLLIVGIVLGIPVDTMQLIEKLRVMCHLINNNIKRKPTET